MAAIESTMTEKKCFPYRWLSLERRSSDQLLPAGRGNGVLLRDIRLRGINTAWALADNKHPFHTKATVQENLLAIHCQWVYKGYLTCFRIQLTARTNTVFRMTIVPFWKKEKNNNGPIMHLNETRVHISGTVGDGFTQQKYRTQPHLFTSCIVQQPSVQPNMCECTIPLGHFWKVNCIFYRLYC